MFFNRFRTNGFASSSSGRRSHRRIFVAAMAVTLGIGSAAISQLNAQVATGLDTAKLQQPQHPAGAISPTLPSQKPAASKKPAAVTLAEPQSAAQQLLTQGVQMFNAGQYEEAQTTLQEITPDALSDRDRATLNKTLPKAIAAATERKNARTEFQSGQQDLSSDQLDSAMTHFTNAATNKFADEGTRRKANEQIVLVEAKLKRAAAANPAPAPAPAVAPVVVAPVVVPEPAPAAPSESAVATAAGDSQATQDAQAALKAAQDAEAKAKTDREAAEAQIKAAQEADAKAAADAAANKTASDAQAAADAKSAADAEAAADAKATADAKAAADARTAANAKAAADAQAAAAAAAAADAAAAHRRATAVAQSDADAAAQLNRIKSAQQTSKASGDASTLVEQARQAQTESRYTDALNLYNQALAADPSNQQAKAGADQVKVLLGQTVAPSTLLDSTIGKQNANKQYIYYTYDTALTSADELIKTGKFKQAQTQIETARVARDTDPTLFTRDEINAMDSRINLTQVSLDKTKQEFDDAAKKQANEAAVKQELQKTQLAEDAQKTKVAELIKETRELIQENRYTQALATIDQILTIDPNNDYALGVRPLVEDKANFQQQRVYREEFDRQFTRTLNTAEEKKIPYDDIVRFSANWPDISELRDREVAADRGVNQEDQAIEAQLERRLPELRFNANALSDVIDFLRDVTGANIYVDWGALERASISKDAPVTARLRDIKFSKALDIIFRSVSGEDEDKKLAYTIDEGVITISTKHELSKNTVTRRYDINDLLFVAPDYTDAPTFTLTNLGSGSGGGGGQSLFGGSGGGGNQNQDQGSNREARIDEIKKYIVENVAPNSWKDNGGEVGSISSSPLRAVLLISQTPENHREVVKVLDSLRASQALQVNIEARFLIVQRNFLNDVGVDIDATFNLNGNWSKNLSPIVLQQNQVNPNTVDSDTGSAVLDWTSNVSNSTIPGNIPSNLADYPKQTTISGSYADDFSVSFLIRAVQANQNSTTLTAPRLTLFSGQRAYIFVATEQAYVSDLTPVVAPGAALFDTEVSTTFQSAVKLDVLATVSPDRKYVYLDLRPELARLKALATFPVSAVVQQVGVVDPTNPPQVITGNLQLPTLEVTSVRTSVSVPDGATLLLGGQTLAGEVTREQGAPIVSKIPFIKRLFTNTAQSKDEQVLLILVKPTILILREQETKQFPLLSTKVAG